MSDDKDYAHIRDPEAQRTRYELWAIIIIVVVVVAGALLWRSLAHKPAGPQKDYNSTAYSANSDAAAGAGVVQSTVLAPSPAPRPAGP